MGVLRSALKDMFGVPGPRCFFCGADMPKDEDLPKFKSNHEIKRFFLPLHEPGCMGTSHRELDEPEIFYPPYDHNADEDPVWRD